MMDRRKAGGDSGLDALRVLKRRLSDVVHAALQAGLAAKHLEPTSNLATAAA
jgi:transposase